MSLRSDDTKGWIGSIIFHLIVGLILFLWTVDVSVSESEFIEVSWGAIAKISTATTERASLPGSEGGTIASLTPKTRSMDLPERTLNADDEVLRVPASRKIDIDEKVAQNKARIAENAKGRKERSSGIGFGEKEKSVMPGSGENAGEVADPNAAGIVGSGVGNSVSVSMQWNDGGSRKKISGNLPTYPPGVNVETQIRIETVVQPDGSVKSLKPAQKGNTKLEEAAMKEVRLWMFEPLRQSSPQRDQTCIITFNFTLR